MQHRQVHCSLLLICLGLGLVAGTANAANDSEGQAWLNNSLSKTLSDSWSFKVTQELRSRDLDYGDRFLENWSVGLFRKMPRSSYLGASYKREVEEKSSFTATEHRLTLEGGWKKTLQDDLTFDTRFRSEFRTYESDMVEDHTRLRLRFRLKTAANIGSLSLKPFVWTELFSSTNSEPTVNRNRFGLGTVIVANPHVDFVVNYIRQDTDGKRSINVLNTGIDLKF